MKNITLLWTFITVLCGYAVLALAFDLPEVYTEDVTAIQVNRQDEYIERALNNLNADIDTLNLRCDTMALDVDALQADVNTLHNRSDSIQVRIDSVQMRIDSSQTRLTALETMRDTIFFAWDASGEEDLPTSSWERLTLDTGIRNVGYDHDNGDEGVGITTAGWYHISCGAAALTDTYSDIAGFWLRVQKYTSSWSQIGVISYGYVGGASLWRASMVVEWDAELAIGDSIAVGIYNASLNAAHVEDGSVWLRIEKIH